MGYSEVLLLFLTRQTHDILEHFLLVYTMLSKAGPGKGHYIKDAADNLDRTSVFVRGGKAFLFFTPKAL